MQRLHANDADEGLHRVVGEHAAATAEAGAGIAGNPVPEFGVRAACDLVGRHDIERLARLRVLARMDRPVRHDDGGLVMLQQGRQRADRRLVAGDDGDGAGKAGGLQMLAQRVVGDFAADQRVAHFRRAVAHPVRGGDGEFRLHQTERQLARLPADPALQRLVDRLHLLRHAEIALAVPLGADHADRRLVDQLRIGAERIGKPDGLGRTARMAVDKDGL